MTVEMNLGPLKELLSHLGSSSPELISRRAGQLYHYTDLGALNGIISHSDLWLTHCRYSNDAEEMNHGMKIAQRVISEMRKTASREMESYLRGIKYKLKECGLDDVYVCCFCDNQNQLSQWRGYGANGSGVELEIQAEQFGAISGPDCPVGLMRFWRVYYELGKQRTRIKEIVDFWSKRPTTLDERVQYASDAIRFFIPTFKHKDFHEESEWRLIFTPGSNCPVAPRFRVARGMLVPYFSLRDIIVASQANLDRLPIERVRIGPSAARDLNVESTRMLLKYCNYEGVPVEASHTPYRA
jgi:hypothetical protein